MRNGSSLSRLSTRSGALIVAMLAAGCDAPGGKSAPQGQVYASMAAPSDCVPGASLKGITTKTNDQLWNLIEHYTDCQDDEDLREQAWEAILPELHRRGDPKAAAILSIHYKYGSKDRVNRERSIYFAREADRLGDPRGREILREWGELPR